MLSKMILQPVLAPDPTLLDRPPETLLVGSQPSAFPHWMMQMKGHGPELEITPSDAFMEQPGRKLAIFASPPTEVLVKAVDRQGIITEKGKITGPDAGEPPTLPGKHEREQERTQTILPVADPRGAERKLRHRAGGQDFPGYGLAQQYPRALDEPAAPCRLPMVGDESFVEHHIPVDEHDVLAPGHGYRPVPTRRSPEPLMGVKNVAYGQRSTLPHSSDQLIGPVSGSIVSHDDFVGRERLA